MVKKKVSKKGSGKVQKSMIKEALLDINQEIVNIKRDRKRLDSQISSSSISIEKARESQKKLQEKIASLLEKEASLKEKNSRLSTKENQLGDRLAKIEKVKSELDGI
jgi:chromosome segregation ATPase